MVVASFHYPKKSIFIILLVWKDAIDDLLLNYLMAKQVERLKNTDVNLKMISRALLELVQFGVLNHEAPKLSIINLKRLSYIRLEATGRIYPEPTA